MEENKTQIDRANNEVNVEPEVMWKLNKALTIPYYLCGTIFTAMVVFILGILAFTIVATAIYTIIIFFFSLQAGKEFQDFLNGTIVYFFNDNKQLFAWIALGIATLLFRRFDRKHRSKGIIRG